MTIAAAKFMAVLTGAAPVPGALAAPAVPAAGFSDAIGTALAIGPVAGSSDPLPAPTGAPVNSLALQTVLAPAVAGENAATSPGPVPTAQPSGVVPEPAQPEVVGEQPAADPPLVATRSLGEVAGSPVFATHEAPAWRPVAAFEIEPKPSAKTARPDEEIARADVVLPEPGAADIQEPELNAGTAVPVMRPTQAATPPAAEQFALQDTTASLAQPGNSRLRRMVDVETTQGSAAPQSAPSFAERLAAPAASAPAPAPDGGPPSALQASPIASERPEAAPAEAAPQPAREHPTIQARPGRIGRDMGVEIARHLSAGGEELTVRLNPAEMGRIEVRLSFDDRGTLRAVVAAESAAALDMLRRDHADLGRALTDAGVRADAQSFRFDSRSGGGEGGQFWQRQQQGGGRQRGHAAADDAAASETIYRPLRASGRIDLMA